MIKRFLRQSIVVLALGTTSAFANSCFVATGELGQDAQTIRQTAAQMGWVVGNAASLTASGVAKGKVKLYPKGSTKVCLGVDAKNELAINIQSDSSDAGQAEWRKLPAKRT